MVLLALAVPSACLHASRDQLLAIVQGGKYGYIDHTGRIVIQPQFIWAEDFWRDRGTVYVCGRYVSIDRSGTIGPPRVVGPGQPTSFDEALPFSDGLAAVKSGQKWGFVDTAGRLAIPARFTAAFYFHEGVATAELDSSTVLIDRSGRVLASGYQFHAGIPSHGRVPATRRDKSGYLDLQGRVAIPFVYDAVTTFSGGLAAVEREGKWGYIDRDGRMVIAFGFDDAGPFGSGLAPIKTGTRTGFIDKSGRFAFELPFESAAGFLTGDEESNLFIADSDVSRFWTADNRFGYVNTSGRVIWGPTGEHPDHRPLLGWTDDMKAESCRGIPESTKAAVSRL